MATYKGQPTHSGGARRERNSYPQVGARRNRLGNNVVALHPALVVLDGSVHESDCTGFEYLNEPEDNPKLRKPCEDVFEPEEGEPIPWPGVCPSLFYAYGPRDGCVNEVGPFGEVDNLEREIGNMYYEYFAAIRQVLHKEVLGTDTPWKTDIKGLEILVSPDYEDHTYVLVSWGDFVVLKYSCKPWNFCWDSLEEMNETISEIYEEAKAKLEGFMAVYPKGKFKQEVVNPCLK